MCDQRVPASDWGALVFLCAACLPAKNAIPNQGWITLGQGTLDQLSVGLRRQIRYSIRAGSATVTLSNQR